MTENDIKKLEEIIIRKVRPRLREHNGDVVLLEVAEDGIVKVRLTGTCSACPGAQQTLSEVIEAALKEEYPTIRGVVPVYQVSNELLDSARAILRRTGKCHEAH
ncbi:MAG: nfuA, partial [Firmicutes bacterium]|nr:nfuA [Bacillota bacterium]